MRVKRMPEFPPRPYIPPLFFCVVGCAALSMLLLENSWEQAKAGTWCGISIAFPVVVSLLAVLACAVAACVRRRYDLEFSMGSLGLAFACFIALICSLSIWTNAVASQIREVKGTASSYMFEVIGDSSLGERGYSFTALARRKDGNGPTFRVRVTGEKMLTRGERFYAVGSFLLWAIPIGPGRGFSKARLRVFPCVDAIRLRKMCLLTLCRRFVGIF